jgi:hypothetical protein
VVPDEALGGGGLEPLGDLLVVQPWARAVQPRRDDQADERGDQEGDGRHPDLVGAQALEPEEGAEQQAEDRAAQVGPLGPVLHDRDAVEDGQDDRRRQRKAWLAAGAGAVGPEGGQRGEHGDERAAEHDGAAHPLVHAAVGHRDAGHVGDPVSQPDRQVVPGVGHEQAQRDPRRQHCHGDHRERRPAQRRQAQAPGCDRPRGDERAAAGRGRRHGRHGAQPGGRPQQPGPVHRAEQRQRDEGGQAGERRLGHRARGGRRPAWRRHAAQCGLGAHGEPSRSARRPAVASAATRRRAVRREEPAS